MDYHCGIIRNEKELRDGLEKLANIKTRAKNVYVENTNRILNTAWHTALDLNSLLTVSEMMLRTALERRESRGGHTREDFAESDDAWGKKHVILKKSARGEPAVGREEGGMTIQYEAIEEMPAELKNIIQN